MNTTPLPHLVWSFCSPRPTCSSWRQPETKGLLAIQWKRGPKQEAGTPKNSILNQFLPQQVELKSSKPRRASKVSSVRRWQEDAATYRSEPRWATDKPTVFVDDEGGTAGTSSIRDREVSKGRYYAIHRVINIHRGSTISILPVHGIMQGHVIIRIRVNVHRADGTKIFPVHGII